MASTAQAQSLQQNPIVQTCFTADPAPVVFGDRLYVYLDRDQAESNGYTDYYMDEWRVYSTTDMVNWTDHGAVMPISTFKWARKGTAWASQCIERNGKYYWYVATNEGSDAAVKVGVAVADNPLGPFTDPLGKPMITGGWGYIDPTPFIDDDGQAYLYFGNPWCHYVRLNDDMISYSGEVETIEATAESFGGSNGFTFDDWAYHPTGEDCYMEGPWLTKRDGLYYLIYAAGGIPEHISYSTATSPTGPWTYRGQVMPQQDTGSFTNHAGIAEYKGNNYFFYHNGWLPGGGGFARSIAVEEFSYNADGTIPELTATKEGPKPIATLNPYSLQQAETISWADGLKTAESAETGVYITDAHDGDYIRVREVDFGQTGAGVLTYAVASNAAGGSIEVHADDMDGELIATLPVSYTGGETEWKEVKAAVNGITGKHNVFFVMRGEGKNGLFNLDRWQFTEKSTKHELVGLNTTVSCHSLDTKAANGNTATLTVTAVYSDGTEEDVTSLATYTSTNGCLTVDGNTATATAYGDGIVNVAYAGVETQQAVKVSDLDLTTIDISHDFDLSTINPSIFSEGTYNPSTHAMQTGLYGFGGWQFDAGLDLSDYDKLYVELEESQSCGASFRLFDQNNYWTSPATYDMGSSTKLEIDLHAMTNEKGETIDPSHLFIIGWWSYGGSDIKIKSVYATGKAVVSGVKATEASLAAASREAIFNLNGQQVGSSDRSLKKGIYIKGGKKVIVK